MKLGRWMADNHFFVKERVPSREAVFGSVARRVRDLRVLYLEFGVWEGESMRWWSDALKHPGSHLHGFDSFEEFVFETVFRLVAVRQPTMV